MIERLNIAMFKYINHFAGVNSILDNFAVIIAKYLLFGFILWLIYLWFKKGKEYKNIALYGSYSAVLGLLLNFMITSFYYHPRPFMVQVGKLLIQHAPETSFPSDHVTFMLSVAFMLIYFRETRMSGLILSIVGFIGGLSRVFSGLHFPMDIIGSFGVSLLSSFLIYSLRSKLKALNQILVKLYFKVSRNERKNI